MSTQAEAKKLNFEKVNERLELIPDPRHLDQTDENEKYAKSLFNAENLTITNEGRVFVTGSLEVCEIIKINDKYQLKKIPISISGGPRNYFRNGIKACGSSLYLACAHIYNRDKSLFPNPLGDIRKTDQRWSASLLYAIADWDLGYEVDSFILRADLNKQEIKFTEEIQFTEEIPLPKQGKCFANGLDCDGEALYVANSFGNFIHKNAFFKVLLSDKAMTKIESMVFSPTEFDRPNGLKVKKVKDGYLYFTCSQSFPIMTSCLKKIKISDIGVEGMKPIVIYESPFSVFDDFDIVNNGFVIADILAGCLRFVEFEFASGVDHQKGTPIGICKDKNIIDKKLISPSSVEVVKEDSKLFEKGDILITEKRLHCVSRLRPDDELRRWLVG